MRIGDPTPPPEPSPETSAQRRSLAEDLFDAVSSSYRRASMTTKLAAAAALDHGDYQRASASVRTLFETVAAAFVDS